MSVYKPKKSTFYHYDFQLKGVRYTGSTGQRRLKAAVAVEDKVREDAKLGRLNDASQYTLDLAVGRWWTERGQDTKYGQKPPRPLATKGRRKPKKAKLPEDENSPLEARLERMVALFPAGTKIADLDQAMVAEAVEKRRRIPFKRSKAKDAKEYLPSNATVNRDVISLLRPVLRRARTNWGAKGLPEINWTELHLEEPRETVRVYGVTEEERWLDECKRTGWYKGKTARVDAADVSLALDMVLSYGMRLDELFFDPARAFDPDGDPAGPRLRWMKGRKLDVPHEVPLMDNHAREIAARVGRAVAAGLPSIWFYELPNGDLIPISKAGLAERINNAADRAGVAPGRRIHGGRHHAGTVFYRETGDIKLTQQYLGHLDPSSSMRYLHADKSEVRKALEVRQSRNSPGPRKAMGGKPK